MLKHAFTDYQGTPLHLAIYDKSPDAPTLIFIHGMSMHAGAYIDTIPGADFLGALSSQGLTVIALDLQGHGRSGGPRGLFTYKDLMGNISRAVDYALEHYSDRIGVTGTSMGGILSFYAALTDKRIKSAVCHCVLDLRNSSSIFYLKRHFWFQRLSGIIRPLCRLIPWLSLPTVSYLEPRHVFDNIENVQYIIKDPLCTWSYRCSSWISVFLDPSNKPSIEAQETPVRIIVGENDKLFPSAYTRTFYERLRCTKDLVIVPGVRHLLPQEHINITVPLAAEWFLRTL
jgi:alpha-beta hydrolase superfamily lysophospholipase